MLDKHISLTPDQAKTLRDQIVWQRIENLTVGQVADEWLITLNSITQKNYKSGLKRLAQAGLIDPFSSLQVFSLVNHDAIIDRIKSLPMAETSRQARAACYISFTRYLSRRFKGIFTKAISSREGHNKTFYKVHEKVVTNAMNQSQWVAFFDALKEINFRDYLIGKVTLQGGKRINEVLSLKTDQINWETREITFYQSKTKGMIKKIIITYSPSIMDELKDYLNGREGYVFITRNQKPIALPQLFYTFPKAAKKANIPFKVTPHVLRASAVTYLKKQGFDDAQIMKVTGHATGDMVRAYDKSDIADNPTKKINLIS